MSLSLCEFCYEYHVRIEDVYNSDLILLTSLPAEDYQGILEDKNGNTYYAVVAVDGGGVILWLLPGNINPTSFIQQGRDITIQPLQFNQYSDYTFKVYDLGANPAVDDNIPIPMPDGNSYDCLHIKFIESTLSI